MLTEDYCSYEVAKLLKEKGFDWPCHGSYHIEYPKNKIVWSPKPVNDDGQIFMNAPTHQMAMKWLREKDIDIVIMPLFKFKGGRIYCYEVHSETADIRTGQFNTYEEAVEAALKYSLENLI